MEHKPKHTSGYQPESVRRVRQTLLIIASKLGDLMEDIVVVGGLVPYLLVEQEGLPAPRRHVGTLDLDLGLSLAILDDERYREVADRLRAEGFKAVERTRMPTTSSTFFAKCLAAKRRPTSSDCQATIPLCCRR